MRAKLHQPAPAKPLPVPGVWALKDVNGRYLLETFDYSSSRGLLGIEPRRVLAWTDLEVATLLTHEQALDRLPMFPAGSCAPVEIKRREALP